MDDKDISGQVASGMVMGCLTIVLLILFGPTLLVVAIIFIDSHWKTIVGSLLLGALGIVLIRLSLPFISQFYLKSIQPRLNQNYSSLRYFGLVVAAFCIFMLFISCMAISTMTRPVVSEDVIFILHLTAILVFSLYLSLAESKLIKKKVGAEIITLDGTSWEEVSFLEEQKSVSSDSSKNLTIDNQANPEGISITNQSTLYCYFCTKKLGLKSWRNSGRYYCNVCRNKFVG